MELTKLEFQIPNLKYCQILFVQKLKQILYLKSSCSPDIRRHKIYRIWITESHLNN